MFYINNWNRFEIKQEAKIFLSKHYWKAFVVCFIVYLLGTVTVGKNIAVSSLDGMDSIDSSNVLSVYGNTTSETLLLIFFMIVFILFLTIFPLLDVGKARFFIEGLKDDSNVEIKTLISTFEWTEAWPIIKTHIRMSISIIFWTFLFIIPGIIKTYEYFFVNYIMADNPGLDTREVLDYSKEITYGHKLDIFILGLSFLGWDILGWLACGLGIFFVRPYKEATYAALYNKLSQKTEVNNYSIF